MARFLRHLLGAGIVFVVLGSLSVESAPQGFLEGQLKIVSFRPGESDGENTAAPADEKTVTAGNYADYPLIILSAGDRTQIARITADANGSYRAALPPGNYILDVEERVRRRLRVKTQPFTVVPNEKVHVDLTIVTGFAAEASTPHE